MDLIARVTDGLRTTQADPALLEQALKYLRQWLTGAEFAPYRPQLEWLIETKQWSGLLDRFYQILPFGTGGRRGPVGIGPNRMNLWTLGASVQGHSEYLRENFPERDRLCVALAYDVRQFEDKGRKYNADLPNPVLHLSSKDFAHYAAGVYVANGIHAYILPEGSTRYLATPELSFIIRQLRTHGGLNISASHNPPDDNGGKFYDASGAQPTAPEDQIMADLVDQVTHIKSLSWAEAQRGGRIHFLDDEPHKAYIELCRRQSLVRPPKFDEIKVVYTPLHGVGSMTALEILEKQGFRVATVAEQMKPDGQFPNVTQSPNPEVPASFDRAEALARKIDADIVLATDPDADRIGAMIKADGAAAGAPQYDFVNGNSLCALLTHFKLAKLKELGRLPRSPVVITTLVSTSQVGRIARHFKAQVVENLLVGFKYHAEVLRLLEEKGAYEDVRATPQDMIIACEESHGVLLMPEIRDKDSGAATLLLAELALDRRRQGSSVAAYLRQIERDFGYFRTIMVPIVMTGVEGKQNMVRMLDALRARPPKAIGGLSVTALDDLRSEQCWMGPIKGATDYAARNFLHFRLGPQARIALRPSGTEPKAKAYIEASSPPCPPGATDETWRQTRAQVDQTAQRLADEFLQLALGLAGVSK
jgi:phosphoglucomutase